MPIDRERLLARVFPEVRHTYAERDVWLYALSLGISSDPDVVEELAYTASVCPIVLPSFATVLADPGFWWNAPDTGIDWRQLVHYRQSVELHALLPVSGTVVGTTRIDDVFDRGEGRGAIYRVVRALRTSDDAPLATVTSWVLGRSDGGFGGPPPESTMDRGEFLHVAGNATERKVPHNAALLFRLHGDINPLHCDPEAAVISGFARPILHGMCTFGIAAFCLRSYIAGLESSRRVRISARFVSPAYPGDTLRTEISPSEWSCRFMVRCIARDVVVLDQGRCEY